MPTKTYSTRLIRGLQSYLAAGFYISRSGRSQCGATSTIRPLRLQHGRCRHSSNTPLSRNISSISPVTAVSLTQTIPASFKALHDELSTIKKVAAEYVNFSQLELAQRSLESEDPVIRIAVFGLNGQWGAKRLIRALLADPLGAEQPWEKYFLNEDDKDTRAFIIRFGEYDFQQRHPLLRILSLPSTFLKNNNTELLVYNLDTGRNDSSTKSALSIQDVLVPILSTPISASGRVSIVSYPVHKALLHGEDIQSILSMPSKAIVGSGGDVTSLIRGSVNTSWRSTESDSRSNRPIILVNLDQAENSIRSFRTALENSFDYEHNWLASNFPALDDFFIAGMHSKSPQSLKPTLRSFISTLLSNTASAISLTRTNRLASVASSAIPSTTLAALSKSVTQWAEDAHTELHDGLTYAFTNPAWQKTAWWKLLWRVDDIGYIASQVLQQSFLVEAEKNVIWLAGRMQQAGLLPDPTTLVVEEGSDSRDLDRELPQARGSGSSLSPAAVRQEFYDVPVTRFYAAAPQNIGRARAKLLESVPTLQALSQTLLLQSVSTTVITSALSALLYVSISTTSLYEAAAVGTLGFIWSVRRLQREWEEARNAWVDRVKEEGRQVLGAIEMDCRAIVIDGGRIGEEPQERDAAEKIAEEAVTRAGQALKKLQN